RRDRRDGASAGKHDTVPRLESSATRPPSPACRASPTWSPAAGWAKLWPVETGRRQAYVVCGNAGVGKSTFAAELCRQKSAVLIDIDTVTERLARLVLRGHGLPEDDRDSPAYKGLLREPVYEALFDVALDNLPQLPCVI